MVLILNDEINCWRGSYIFRKDCKIHKDNMFLLPHFWSLEYLFYRNVPKKLHLDIFFAIICEFGIHTYHITIVDYIHSLYLHYSNPQHPKTLFDILGDEIRNGQNWYRCSCYMNDLCPTVPRIAFCILVLFVLMWCVFPFMVTRIVV